MSDQPSQKPETVSIEDYEAEEYPIFAERMSDFDATRKELYSQIAKIMAGEGESHATNLEICAQMGLVSVFSFDRLVKHILEEESDRQKQVELIAQIVKLDETERYETFNPLTKEVGFTGSTIEFLMQAAESVLETCEENDMETNRGLGHWYAMALQEDVNMVLSEAPKNANDEISERRKAIKEQVLKTALDVGKIAVGAGLAIFASQRIRKN